MVTVVDEEKIVRQKMEKETNIHTYIYINIYTPVFTKVVAFKIDR